MEDLALALAAVCLIARGGDRMFTMSRPPFTVSSGGTA
jgi:hypothetical protein